MASALICTVGTTYSVQNDIVDALVEEIANFRPDLVLFLISRESRENAVNIARRCGLAEGAYDFFELPSIHNLNVIFQSVNEAIRDLHRRGFSNSEISVNYTSGTKVMGSAAVLSAIYHQCRELRYIYESREAGDRVVTTHPSAVHSYRDLLFSNKLIEELRFRAAADLLQRVDLSLLSEYDMQSVTALRLIAEAYYQWDGFRHHQFVGTISGVPNGVEMASRFMVGRDVIEMLDKLGNDIEQGNYTPLLFADMVNNALRRRLEGQLDDAVTRTYRALEMLAQWVLKRHDIDPDDVDTRRVPPRYRVNFEAMRSTDDGQLRIGLRKSFELLALLRTPLGLRFEANEKLAKVLHARRCSILAHGTMPVNSEDCDVLLDAARELFRSEIADFDAICGSLQFPWLRGRV